MADWDQCYYTYDGAYEAAQLKVFQEMLSKVENHVLTVKIHVLIVNSLCVTQLLQGSETSRLLFLFPQSNTFLSMCFSLGDHLPGL